MPPSSNFMLEAHIKIDKDLAIKGFRRALKYNAFQHISYFYALRLIIVWLVIAFANALMGQESLTSTHLLFLFALWVIVSIHGYYKWYKELADTTQGWEFAATLDDAGVTTLSTLSVSEESRYEWDFYQSYAEYEDYLQINDINGGITFLPKTPELAEVVEFTKNKIPENKNR